MDWLKNALTVGIWHIESSTLWDGTLPDNMKSKTKQETLIMFSPPHRLACMLQFDTSIAAIKLPENWWSELSQILLDFINNWENISPQIVMLTAIGNSKSIISSHVLDCKCKLYSLWVIRNQKFWLPILMKFSQQCVKRRNKHRSQCYSYVCYLLEFIDGDFECEVISAILFESQTHWCSILPLSSPCWWDRKRMQMKMWNISMAADDITALMDCEKPTNESKLY